jgi:hypothetical protein
LVEEIARFDPVWIAIAQRDIIDRARSELEASNNG